MEGSASTSPIDGENETKDNFERLDQIQGFVEGPSSRLYREGDDEENFGKDKNWNGCERSVNPVIYLTSIVQ